MDLRLGSSIKIYAIVVQNDILVAGAETYGKSWKVSFWILEFISYNVPNLISKVFDLRLGSRIKIYKLVI